VAAITLEEAIEVSTEAAATFFGYAMRVWEDQRRR
jgi:hypothetical protein